ncbi:hypothetical protein C8J57DRAFT_1239653 [Mycena rebaudengoi]|nr:hypothetical protein C8J57DRAFT_1239653 [Mycena rebaudengoi]
MLLSIFFLSVLYLVQSVASAPLLSDPPGMPGYPQHADMGRRGHRWRLDAANPMPSRTTIDRKINRRIRQEKDLKYTAKRDGWILGESGRQVLGLWGADTITERNNNVGYADSRMKMGEENRGTRGSQAAHMHEIQISTQVRTCTRRNSEQEVKIKVPDAP